MLNSGPADHDLIQLSLLTGLVTLLQADLLHRHGIFPYSIISMRHCVCIF